ncbi:hypothetical protein J2Y03_005587 [Neobacillus niacini]|uniref:hypothetical protein n=1 Tax=Neobacillus niacini TaxID=86668 RepID=UPI0028627E95|nr:hypothetical protein [Neobacillus niacini]MDR7080500.1 hypothetical protein [Neobacillus niacini]
MFGFLNRAKLKKDDLKGIAKLMYQDVSDDSWDKENLTKSNLDFTIESVRYIDMYTKRLMNTEFGTELLNKYFDNLVIRIGAYIGEVIKNNIRHTGMSLILYTIILLILMERIVIPKHRVFFILKREI